MAAQSPFSFSSAVAKFSVKFCNELDKTKNVVSSPLSAEYLLALLTLGSTEPAHNELLKTLHFPDNDGDQSIRSSFGELSTKLKAIKGVTFEVAIKMYIKDGGYDVETELKKDAEKIFDAQFEKMNFKDSATAAQLINKWVERKTKDKIKDLFSSNSFDVFTHLVLVNAIYFKGIWKTKFNAKDTMKQQFHVDNQTSVKIPMMFKADKFGYGESSDLEAQLLEMSYVGGETSMVIVLPNKIDGLDAVLQKLADGYDLMSELKKTSLKEVIVTFPKFKIQTEINLKTLLPELGIKAIFQEKDSGLKKILNTGESLYVSEAVQKAYIEVNEDGAEAAAGSGEGCHASFGITSEIVVDKGLAMVRTSEVINITTSYFRADHPFLYLLMGADSTTLLIGAYRGN